MTITLEGLPELKSELMKFFIIDGDNVSIDWGHYFLTRRDRPDRARQFLFYLRNVGLLSPHDEGNWKIACCQVFVNPNVGMIYLYFTNEEDAKAYALAGYGECEVYR